MAKVVKRPRRLPKDHVERVTNELSELRGVLAFIRERLGQILTVVQFNNQVADETLVVLREVAREHRVASLTGWGPPRMPEAPLPVKTSPRKRRR